jgi:hypothetical protein
MNRRDFLRRSGKASLGMMTLPYILPSGRLFAATGSRRINHVVYVLFAGGIRNQEAVGQQYLVNQGVGPAGNIMPNMLSGSAPSGALVYDPWTPLGAPLQTKGTLFPAMRYAEGPTGHYNGHTVAMTGHYTATGLNLNINPEYPTVFEYYRKHSDPARSALNCWWISTELGPYPSLNYSRHPDYGPQYGANYAMPGYALGETAQQFLGGLQVLHPEEATRLQGLKGTLDGFFDKGPGEIPGINNSAEDGEAIQKLYLDLLNGNDSLENPIPAGVPAWSMSPDGLNVAMAWKIMENFHPELTVINTTSADICHDRFSAYIEQIHKADYAMGWLWNKIQSDPVMANDTVMICIPEHGRNLEPNNLTDDNGLRAYDHTEDDNSREIFGLIVGPPGVIRQNAVVGSDSSPVGESIDIVPTIAELLGFRPEIPNGLLPGRVLTEAFA